MGPECPSTAHTKSSGFNIHTFVTWGDTLRSVCTVHVLIEDFNELKEMSSVFLSCVLE